MIKLELFKYEFIIIFLFNFLVCTFHAIPYISDKYFDLTGAVSFITVIIYSLIKNLESITIDGLLMSIMGILWAFRIGSYLFYRILASGLDSRFFIFKNNPIKLYIPFFLQFIWSCSLLLPILTVIKKDKEKENNDNNILKISGYFLWITGFIIEITADFQKKLFIDKGLKITEGFISSGLWSISRHPNYLGEIILWFGISLIAFSKFCNIILFIAPLITYILLNYVSGINLIEKKTFQRLKNNKKYLKYLEDIPKLFPNLINLFL